VHLSGRGQLARRSVRGGARKGGGGFAKMIVDGDLCKFPHYILCFLRFLGSVCTALGLILLVSLVNWGAVDIDALILHIVR
jgi:hypothetical protein